MYWASWISISAAAVIGALTRWRLAVALNSIFPTLPLGTLAVNLVGGLVMGILIEYFDQNAAVPPPVRLAATTGFLGTLTTFSTFSAETVTLIFRGEYLWAGVEIFAHVIGSLLMTTLGILIIRFLLAMKGTL